MIAQLRQNIEGAATYEAATEASTRATVGRLIEGSAILRHAFESGRAVFLPALYRLGDGRVDLLG